MRVDEFDFDLPEQLIALRPASPRDASRLLVIDPEREPRFADRMIADLPDLLSPGDALVFNDTRVIPAELQGTRERDGAVAHISVTLIERLDDHRWQALARPAKRLKEGDRINFGEGGNVCLTGALNAIVEARGAEGEVTLSFELSGAALDQAIATLGAMPLPPYIASRRAPDERDRTDYQTMFAARGGRCRRADRRPAFHPEAHRGPCGARHLASFRDAACRRRDFSAGARRRHRGPWMHAERGSISAKPPPRSTR